LQIRQFILGSILAIPAVWVLLAPASMQSIPPRDRVVVEYWEKWTGLEAAKMKEIVDEYNATAGKKKNIFINYISMSSIDRKLLISTAGGAPPDLAGIWSDQIAQFASQDAFYPLDELAKEYGITEQLYKPVYWDMCRYQGRLWGLVSSSASIVMHYNRELFWENAGQLRAAGLDPTRGPLSMDELDRYAQALDEFNHKGELNRAGYLPTEPGWYTPHTGLWFGTGLFNPEKDEFIINHPASVRAFTWFQSYSKRLGPNTASSFKTGFGSFASAGNPFLIRKVAIIQQGPWMALYFETYAPHGNRLLVPKNLEVFMPVAMRNCNYAWAAEAFPSAVGQTDVTIAVFDTFCIPKGAKHKKEAFDFMAYCNRPEVMEKLSSIRCVSTPLRTVSRNFVALHPNPYIEVFERIAASPNAKHEPSTPVYREAVAEINPMLEKINLLEIGVEEGLTQVQNVVSGKLASFKIRQHQRRKATPP